MTKKRFKFGLAVLGVLGIFFMALLALVFAPSLASADKSTALGHHQDGESQSSHHNPAFYALYDGPQGGPHPHGGNDLGDRNSDYCALNHCDPGAGADGGINHDGYQPGGQNGSNGQSGANAQGGSGNGQGDGQGNGPGPYAGGGFGGPGGYFAPGTPGGNASDCPDGMKTCDKGTGGQDPQGGQNSQGDKNSQGGQDSQGDHGSNGDGSPNNDGTNIPQSGAPHGPNDPSGNGDPQPGPGDFTTNNPTGGDPMGDNPPVTVLTDAPVQVPEPFTLSLFTVGLGGAALLRRRSKGSRNAA